ncbi:MAG: 5-carboxymethyl-2-hydroxymuconate isomerase [Alphaproteobacteria bacterium]
MPHIFIDYSANLDGDLDVSSLANAVHDAAVSCGLFPTSGVRTRVMRQETYVIADKKPENAFVHVIARIGIGRAEDAKKIAGDQFFSAISNVLDPIANKRPLAFAFEFVEVNTWKKNSIIC